MHNLRAVDFRRPDTGYDWAYRFDAHAKEVLLDDPTSVTGLDADPDYARAVPTPDHFLPLLYFAGLAGDADEPVELLVDGHAAGSISMAAYTLGASCPRNDSVDPAAPLPESVPADQTNL